MSRMCIVSSLAVTLGLIPCCLGPPGPEFDYLYFDRLTEPPGPSTVTSRELELMEDTAAAFLAWPISANDVEFSDEGDFVLRSRDSGVMEVFPATDAHRWAILGVAPGETCIEVVVLGKVEDCILAKTTAQP